MSDGTAFQNVVAQGETENSEGGRGFLGFRHHSKSPERSWGESLLGMGGTKATVGRSEGPDRKSGTRCYNQKESAGRFLDGGGTNRKCKKTF